jgi:uncharacterized Zn-binding protein involved in type VI secretion
MGKPAARVGDAHTCPLASILATPHVGGNVAPPGCTTVLIGGVPAARMGDLCICADPMLNAIAKGSTRVFIGGKPAARALDPTVHGGTITTGCPSVLIG